MSFQISGLASDIDTRKLIDDLMYIERRPIRRLEDNLSIYKREKTAWGEVKTQLANLRTKLSPLKEQSTFNAKKTSSSNENVVKATADHTAIAGTYNLTVQQLATPSSMRSITDVGSPLDLDVAARDAGFATRPTNGFITMGEVIDGQYRYTQIEIDNTKSLNEITNDINTALSDAGLSLSVSFIDDKFQVVSDAGNEIRLGSGADTSNFLATTKVLSTSQTGSTIESSSTLGVVNLRANLENARFKTPLEGTQGSFKINGVEISWDTTDPSKDSLEDIMRQINNSNAKVRISYDSVGDKFTLVNTETGSKAITLEDVEGNFLEAIGLRSGTTYAETNLGKNALYTIDEINDGLQLSSSSNTVSNVVTGVSFELNSISEEKTRITISNDVNAVYDVISKFVSQYNSTMANLESKTATGVVGEDTRGVLSSNSSLRRLQTQLRGIVTSPAGNSDLYQTLNSIGISTTNKDNRLSIDEAKLRSALETNSQDVYELFYNGSDGIYDKMDATLDSWLKSYDGIITTSTNSLDKQIRDTERRIEDMEYRMILREQHYEAKFLAMERALSQYNSQSQWLDQQLQQFAPRK